MIDPNKLKDEVDKFMDASSLCSDEKPKFVLMTGITGAGKTTIRKKDYSDGHVVVDAAEILENLSGQKGFVEIDQSLEEPMQHIGEELVKRTINEKRNFVTEIIGSEEIVVKSLLDRLVSLGYEAQVKHVHCDSKEAYQRHLSAVKNDPHYLSSYFTQDSHIKWILKAIKNIE